MSAHTPGPWAVHPISARVDAFAGGRPLPVCELLWPTDERSEAETEANAHLIAAAPDLLASLSGFCYALSLQYGDRDGDDVVASVAVEKEHGGALAHRYLEARQLIAIAEDRS